MVTVVRVTRRSCFVTWEARKCVYPWGGYRVLDFSPGKGYESRAFLLLWCHPRLVDQAIKGGFPLEDACVCCLPALPLIMFLDYRFLFLSFFFLFIPNISVLRFWKVFADAAFLLFKVLFIFSFTLSFSYFTLILIHVFLFLPPSFFSSSLPTIALVLH